MANGRSKGTKGDSGRDSGGFVALPWSVLDSAAYADLGHPARSLLFEIARQFVRDNNGRLLLSRAHMEKRGWKSSDMLTKCKRELLAAGFIFETVKGQRPNRASWYAVTWQRLERHPDYDPGAFQCFERGAYRKANPLKNASLVPPRGTDRLSIGPPHGTRTRPTVPPHGTIKGTFRAPPVPPHGNHLDKPSGRAVPAVLNPVSNPSADQHAPPGPPPVPAADRMAIALQAIKTASERHKGSRPTLYLSKRPDDDQAGEDDQARGHDGTGFPADVGQAEAQEHDGHADGLPNDEIDSWTSVPAHLTNGGRPVHQAPGGQRVRQSSP